MSRAPRIHHHKPDRVNTLSIAARRVATMSESERDVIMVPTLEALGYMRESIAAAHHWNILAEACGIGLTLTEVGICSDVESVDLLTTGYIAIGDIGVRFPATHHYAPQGSELAAIEAAIERHAVQLLLCTPIDLHKAVKRREQLKKLARKGRLQRITATGVQP